MLSGTCGTSSMSFSQSAAQGILHASCSTPSSSTEARDNQPDQPLHLAGRKGMPGRQGHAVPPCVIVVCKGIIVFLRHTRLNAVGHLPLPGIQAPELRVAGSPYPVAKPQIQHAVAPVAAGLQGII